MEFKTADYSPMDREYYGPGTEEIAEANIEKPLIPMSEIGQSVTEGRQFGTFRESLTAAIRTGAGRVELATQMEGTDRAVGAESYGKDARRELREMARANQVMITSVHSPTQVGSLSGFAGPERGFDDQQRKVQLEEVKKAVEFAADTAEGGAIVVHTGEYQRPISDARWARDEYGNQMFLGYEEEPERAVIPIVDKRTGHVLYQVRKSQIVARAVWNKHEGESYTDSKGQFVNPGDYIDYEGTKVGFADRVPKYNKEKNTFEIHRQSWDDIVKEAEERNRAKEQQLGRQLLPEERIKPEEAFLQATTETQEKIARGWAGNYARHLDQSFEYLNKLKKAKEFYDKLEANVPKEELWKLQKQDVKYGLQQLGLVPIEGKLPSQLIDEAMINARREIDSAREMVAGQLQQAEEQAILRDNAISVDRYALKQSMKSYAELGIYAMDITQQKGLKRDLFVAPENLFPEMGYGAHPEELIELVQDARKAMAEKLVKQRHMSESEARKEAEQHIKATLDTQHIGMWRKHFVPKQSETKEETDKRFSKWYMDEIKKMEEAKIIGHIHVVDGFGRGHTHVAAGQGIMPVKTAVEYLKEKGYDGTMVSEAFGEDAFGMGRILTQTWAHFGSPVYATGFGGRGGGGRWSDIQHSYFGRTYPPYFIFGAYAPSNDWTLWSQVPME